MNWYYVENGQQAGPATQEQFEELCRSGRVTDQTLVWREGMPDWQPWGTVRAAGAPPVFGTPGGVACAGCGKSFRPEEVIRVNDRFVCAACKPAFLQRVREGVSSGSSASFGGGGTVSLEEVEARDYEHDLGDYITRGWELFKSDPGVIIGASVAVYACLIGPQIVARLLGIIPLVGILLALPIYLVVMVVSGPLVGGLWLFYLKKIRGLPATVGDGFSGFGPKFGQLFLAHLVPTLLGLVCYIPGAILMVVGVVIAEAQHKGSPLDNPVALLFMGLGVLLLVAGVCVILYLTVNWMFALPLVADKGMKFWPAMGLSRKVVSKHWWMTFLIMIVFGLLGSVGAIACLVGLLVTGPVAFASFGYTYEKLFGDLAPQG